MESLHIVFFASTSVTSVTKIKRSVTRSKPRLAWEKDKFVTLVTLVTPHLKKFSKVFFSKTTVTNATNAGGVSRNIYQSTSAPSGGDGAVGDLWILYS